MSSAPSSDVDEDDYSTLPFAAPLLREVFLSPNFDAQTYLSSLSNRHQTLEDLRSELRARSQLLNKELLDLVNDNYQAFLDLGKGLRGGDEKVEEVRVGVLGFRRDVEGLKSGVVTRVQEVDGLVEEKVRLRKAVMMGRSLLEIQKRLEELEERLMLDSTGKRERAEFDDSDEDEDEDEDELNGADSVGVAWMSLSRLRRHVQQYLIIVQMVERIGRDHPFMVAQESRIMRIRNTILLDLGAALKQANAAGTAGSRRVVDVMTVYKEMDESAEAVKALKDIAAG